MANPPLPFLRTPPFPGSHARPFAGPRRGEWSDANLDDACEAIRAARVGGTYWGRHPELPERPYALVCVREKRSRARVVSAIAAERPIVWWSTSPLSPRLAAMRSIQRISGCCDPWVLVEGADELIADFDSELVVIAALAGKRITLVDGDLIAAHDGPEALRDLLRNHPSMNFDYANPFTGESIQLLDAVELCASWRRLIDSNRSLVAAMGFAGWKRPTVAPLLWAGSADVAFISTAGEICAGDQVAVWRSRISAATLADLRRRRAHLVEVEDGFIRSIGLGAECVPPLSIIVDRLGVYFDPSTPSELENLIQEGGLSPPLLDRARALRELIIERGISKYGVDDVALERRSGDRPHLLVVGQVEDDRSVIAGGGAVGTNLELLRRVRSSAPTAFITYKPHPDVAAGHRIGVIPQRIALEFADAVIHNRPIGALINVVDEVHVNTSLVGFEALLRGKPVVTYGVPFYAGWGLTRDLGAVPRRRTARPTLDELVAAVLLVYPRYLDPESGLPCSPEILISRMTSTPKGGSVGILAHLRRLQGRLKRGAMTIYERGRA